LLIRLGIALAIVVFQALLIWGTFRVGNILDEKIKKVGETRFKPIKFRNLTLLEPEQMIRFSSFIVKILKLVVAVFQLAFSIPTIFGLFEPTKNLAHTLWGYILDPIKNFVTGFLYYIPNLFAIVIIIIIARYILRALNFFAKQIIRGKLVLPGFYPEWATPTYNILRVLVIAFTIAFVYPHLPNSDSDIFKGVSMLVGVLFSLGSSTVIGNLISGIVMTYMRPFRKGDRIKINDVTGFVIERGAMSTKIRTHKNEIVSFPNQMVMSNAITNFTSAASPETGLKGLIMHAEITMGYDVPFQKVHEILINAALQTKNTETTPPPFVNQLKLDDFYCWYEINVYTKHPDVLPSIYSELYANIQRGFAENGISMYAPHFQVQKHVDVM